MKAPPVLHPQSNANSSIPPSPPKRIPVTPALPKEWGGVLCVLFAVVLALIPASSEANFAFGQTTVGEDWNFSSTNPDSTPAATPGTPKPVTYCPWVVTGLNDKGYTQANGWKFTWAGAAASAFVQRDISITKYFSWVVNSPNNLGLDNVNRNIGIANQDAGGATFQFKYTPQGTDPQNVRFIQAYNESFNGGAFKAVLDNGNGTARNGGSPFYDAGGVSGTYANGIGKLGNGASWFQDTPADRESNIFPAGQSENNETKDPSSDVQFQVFVAVDNGADPNNRAIQHRVTLYGGDWWGYNYWTWDPPAGIAQAPNDPYPDNLFANLQTVVPEPSTFIAGALLALPFGLHGLRKVRARKQS